MDEDLSMGTPHRGPQGLVVDFTSQTWATQPI
jgi:hypothetical protein